MSARTQLLEPISATDFSSASMFLSAPPSQSFPFFMAKGQSPGAITGGQTSTRTFPAIVANGNASLSSYPSKPESDDEQLLYTYASFHEEPIAALSINSRHSDTWSLCIEIPLPSDSDENPTLLALDYMVKYATTCDTGNSTIQTDTLLTTGELPEGVVVNPDLDVYVNKTGYAPRMVDHERALRLSTTLAVKSNGNGEQWSHYIDNQHIAPNVRVAAEDSRLYVVFHVCEYPTLKTVRSLSVEVSATWQKEEVEIKAKQEAERKAKEKAEKKAQEEAERKNREAEERQAREEERQAREEERQARNEYKQAMNLEQQARKEEAQAREEERKAREEERQAKEEERQAREEERKARNEERKAREEERQAREAERTKIPSVSSAPDVADDKIQGLIADTMKRLKLDACSSGYEFVKTQWGYQCTSGGHKVTFEELGMK